MSSNNITLDNKIDLLNEYLLVLKNINYMPFFYKIISILPIDLYDLLLGDKHVVIPGFVASESFNAILNFLFFDINILHKFLYNESYKTISDNVITMLGKDDFKNSIINDTQKVYSDNQDIFGIVNILNNNSQNILVKELIEKYPHYDINNNNNTYFKETKFLSIVNFIEMLTKLLNQEYSSDVKNYVIDILMYIIEKNLDIIKHCFSIKNNLKLKEKKGDYNVILNELDSLLNDYSSDSVLTFVKLRSDNKDDYNRRFNYKLYSKEINQKIMKIDTNGNITTENKKIKKNKIMTLHYNDDDFQYYKKESDGSMVPNYNNDENNPFMKSYPKSHITGQNYTISDKVYKYTYIFGPLSEIYDYNLTNKEISDKLDVVINSLIKQKPVLIIGYGASGAGKTSTLIYFNKGKDNDSKNGILVHLCNRMAIEHNFDKIKLKCREFYVPENKETPEIRYFPEKKEDYIEFKYESNQNIFKLVSLDTDRKYRYKNKYTDKSYPNLETIYTENSSLGELIINLIDNDRFVAATTNNPNSSRSHSLIFITLVKTIKDTNGNDKNYESTIIIGDFAGVENLFDCDSHEFQEKFYNVNRDDTQLDDGKKKIIELKIETLEKELQNKKSTNIELSSKNKEIDDKIKNLKIEIDDKIKNLKKEIKKLENVTKNKEQITNLKKELKNFEDKLKNLSTESEVTDNLRTKQSNTLEIKNGNNKIKDIEKQIENAKKILNSFEKKEYYHKYPIQPYYDKSQKEYEKFDLQFQIVKNIFIKESSEPPFKTGDPEKFNLSLNDLSSKPSSDKYKVNINNCINIIIEEGYKKEQIINSFENIKNNLGSKDLYVPTNIEIIILKSMFGMPYDKEVNDNSDISAIFDKKLIKHIGEIFVERNYMNNRVNIYKFIKYFTDKFNELKKIYDTKSEKEDKKKKHLEYGKKVCLVRRNEGVFINDSLNNVRDLVNYIMIEKNKYKLSLTPPFVNECLNFYCTKDACFELKKKDIYDTYNKELSKENIGINIAQNKPFKSIIFNVIIEELGIKIKDIIISVFCVFNISKSANNPPPVPYISLNKLKYLYYNKIFNEFDNELGKYNC